MKCRTVTLLMAIFFSINVPVSAGDSCYTPTSAITAVSTSGSVPVGTVIIWPFSTNPEGWSEGKWLECNGQSVSASAYPELRALVGANVPDLRGLFLRGTGGNAAALGTVQEDAGRNITGTAPGESNGNIFNSAYSGAFYVSNSANRYPGTNGAGDGDNAQISFNASRSWGAAHTANEFRPRNRAVRYLISAKS